MKSEKRTVRIVGALFLIQLTAAILSYSVILDPLVYHADFINEIWSNATAVKSAMFLDLICGVAIVGIAILLLPILKKYSERIAIWYVGLRLVEFTTIILSGILLLTLLSVSGDYVNSTASSPEQLEQLAKTIRSARGWTQNMTILSFCLGAGMFYFLLFKSRLLPRFIPVWGLIGVSLALTEIVGGTFGTHLPFYIYLPMGLNEIFLGIWLISRGFRPVTTNTKIVS